MTESREIHPVVECAYSILDKVNEEQNYDHRIGEASLTRDLVYPRNVVRSALDHLEISGIVERVPRAGTYLKQFTVKDFSDAMDVRSALEGLSAQLASLRVTDAEIEELRTLATAMDKVNDVMLRAPWDADFREALNHDLKFHNRIAELSGNDSLTRLLITQRLIEQTFRVPKARPLLKGESPFPSHVEIVEAIASRDPEQAHQVASQHILKSKEWRLSGILGLATNPGSRAIGVTPVHSTISEIPKPS